MAKTAPNTVDKKGLANKKLVALVTKHHNKKTPQIDMPGILEDAGFTTASGSPITVDTVRRFEAKLGLASRRPELGGWR